MRVLITSEARFERTADGAIWAPAACGSALWNRYLEVFSSVLVAARIVDAVQPSAGLVPASGPQVAFCALPPYSGLGGLLRSSRILRRVLARAVAAGPAIIVRSPSPIAQLAARTALARRRPYGAEIVGDPDQVFASGAFHHPLRSAVRIAATAGQAHLSRHAAAVMFVTERVLQRKYPTLGQAFAASDAALDDAAFEPERPREFAGSGPFRLVTVAALDQPYKGTTVLLEAVRELRRDEVPVRLRIVGSGSLLPVFEAQARALGIDSHVDFLGQLDRTGVRAALDASQLFVLPSLTEGLPRALLEAMARGLPAVATDVGGVPELLPAECLVPARDAAALARKIRELMARDDLRAALGERNRQAARAHHERLQAPIRKAFLLALRKASENDAWEAACA
ncbi:MAG: glycosyltransferase family 4 protein [Betaproteobacteria bacterium]